MGKTYCGALFFRDRGTEGKNGRKSNKYNELPVPPGRWDSVGQEKAGTGFRRYAMRKSGGYIIESSLNTIRSNVNGCIESVAPTAVNLRFKRTPLPVRGVVP